MSYAVVFTEDADDDITRLYAFLLERADTLEALELAEAAVKVIRETSLNHLATTPFSYRKVGPSPTLR